MEQWKDIPDYEGYYQVSNLGRVKSLARWVMRKGVAKTKTRILKAGLDKSDRPVVVLCIDKERMTIRVCRLVLLSFVGPCPDGMEARHKDGNPKNNRLNNLCWDTPKNNQGDRFIHGTDTRGEGNGRSVLTWGLVKQIRERYLDGNVSQKQLSVEYGVSHSVINKIVNNKSWVEP